MDKNWQLQEAKNKFSSLVDKALAVGPQVVSRHGVPTVVVIAFAEFSELTKKKRMKPLGDFLAGFEIEDLEKYIPERDEKLRPSIFGK